MATILETPNSPAKLVVVVGETGSGKSALAMELAERFDGELICADSRTVYKGMDIGTAKPSVQEQARVKHHLLDIVEPDQPFTAVEFKRLANEAIDDISRRNKIPIMVGGTGLYISGVLFDFSFEKDLPDKKLLRSNTLILGLRVPKDELKRRIQKRTEQMLKNGLEDEVRALSKKFGWHASAMTGIGYREFQAYFAGLQTLDKTAEKINTNTMLYAKRQRTWLRPNHSIQWLDDPENSVELVTTFLNKK
jgi:tRNA dimethylallyltransferase